MVTPTNINVDSLRGRAFKGFVQFLDPNSGGTIWYRMKERQNMNLSFNFNRVEHYTDDGQLVVDPAGIRHTFSITFKLTSDMFTNDFITTSTDKSISYWIWRNQQYDPIEVVFVTTYEISSSVFINIKFRLDPNTFTTSQSGSGGSPEMTISGTVLSITEAVSDTTGDQ